MTKHHYKRHTQTHTRKKLLGKKRKKKKKITQYILGKGVNKIIKKVKIIFVLPATL